MMLSKKRGDSFIMRMDTYTKENYPAFFCSTFKSGQIETRAMTLLAKLEVCILLLERPFQYLSNGRAFITE